MTKNNKKIAVIGCGYVGLPLINTLGNYYQVIGYDIDESRILELKRNKNSNAVKSNLFKKNLNVNFTSKFDDIINSNIFIITLPTPLNSKNLPHLDDIKKISKKISKILKKGDLVIYESTVFPGATDEIFIPDLQKYNKWNSYCSKTY